jgi:hypothetical protein
VGSGLKGITGSLAQAASRQVKAKTSERLCNKGEKEFNANPLADDRPVIFPAALSDKSFTPITWKTKLLTLFFWHSLMTKKFIELLYRPIQEFPTS